MNLKRKAWVDVIRGVCVFLVVMGHLTSNRVFHIFANQIKMPMFYVISGLFIMPNKKTVKFITDSAFRLGIPWLIFSLVWLRVPYYVITGNYAKIYVTLAEFATGTSVWFIPSFFVTQLLFMSLYKVCHGNKIILFVESLFCFAIGYFTAKSGYLEFWSINAALSGVLFMFIGYLLRDLFNQTEKIKTEHVIYSGAAYLVLCLIGCIIKPNATLDFHNVEYGNLPLNLALITAGIAVSITMSVYLSRKYQMPGLCMLGRNTLIVYLLSSPVAVVIVKILNFIGIPMREIMGKSVFAAFLMAVIICVICTAVSEICSRKLPWSVGLKRLR